MTFPGIDQIQSAEELERTLFRIGEERYHNLHPFHRLLHEGQLSRGQVQAWALAWGLCASIPSFSSISWPELASPP